MSQIAPLDPVAHADLRIRPGFGPDLWVPHQMVPVVPSEFARAAGFYPIFLTKNSSTGRFEFSILLGIAEAENLFITREGIWDGYVPLSVTRQPFGLVQRRADESHVSDERLMTIDLGNPRISRSDGEPIFLEHGGFAPRFLQAKDELDALVKGTAQSEEFVSLLLELNLVEPLKVTATLDGNERIELEGLYTANEELVRSLADGTAGELNRNGALKLIYAQLNSLVQFEALTNRKNRRAVPHP